MLEIWNQAVDSQIAVSFVAASSGKHQGVQVSLPPIGQTPVEPWFPDKSIKSQNQYLPVAKQKAFPIIKKQQTKQLTVCSQQLWIFKHFVLIISIRIAPEVGSVHLAGGLEQSSKHLQRTLGRLVWFLDPGWDMLKASKSPKEIYWMFFHWSSLQEYMITAAQGVASSTSEKYWLNTCLSPASRVALFKVLNLLMRPGKKTPMNLLCVVLFNVFHPESSAPHGYHMGFSLSFFLTAAVVAAVGLPIVSISCPKACVNGGRKRVVKRREAEMRWKWGMIIAVDE